MVAIKIPTIGNIGALVTHGETAPFDIALQSQQCMPTLLAPTPKSTGPSCAPDTHKKEKTEVATLA